MKIATLNLDYGWTPARQQLAADRIAADVTATQEDVRGNYRERVTVDHTTVTLHKRGRRRANPITLGYLIRRRWFAWALVEHDDVPTPFYVVSVHFPPARMPLLYPLMGRRLRAFLAGLDHPWVVAGDWNRRRWSDPAGLKGRFRAAFYGHGIDLFAVHPALTRHVAGTHVRVREGEHLHPVVTLDLGSLR